MNEKPFAWHRWIWDPFTRLAGGLGLAIGLAILVLQAVWSWQGGLVLDGVLDLHYGQFGLVQHLLLGVINLLSLSVMLGLLALWLAPSRFRWIDLLGTLAIARWPMFLAMGVSSLPIFRAATERIEADPLAVPATADLVVLLLGSGVVIVGLLGMILLSYRAYSISCNIRGLRGAVSFIAGLVLAEIVSKLGVYWLLA